MEQQKHKVKFYQSKWFRALIAIVLAVVLLSDNAIQNMASLLASEQEVNQQEITLLGQEPAPGSEDGPEPEDGEGPQGDPAPHPQGEAEGAAGAGSAAAHTLAEAIVAEGAAYVSVHGELYSSPRLHERALKGHVSGIAVATEYREADAEAGIPAAVRVVFATEGGLEGGYMSAGAAALQDYDEVIERIGEDAALAYRSAAWPLPLAGFE
ncbi:MAG: hypothetical protein FWE77_05000, partial [Clostridia bacterium]|nr:hypothetical protein [Clostridia bacterium]